MDPSALAAAALQARNRIVKNQGDEVITTSDKSGGPRTSFQKAPSINFSVPKTAKPEKPADWKKPDKKYGGNVPAMTEGPGGSGGPAPVRPDLSMICESVVSKVKSRKERITTPGYHMKVRDSCPLPCCQYLHQQNEEPQQTVIIKKVIRRRRPKQQAPPQEQAPGQVPSLVQSPPPLLSSPPALAGGPSSQVEQQAAEVQRRQQAEAARRQQIEAERRRQAELQRQQIEAERKRQEELQRQQQAAAEAERQRQAAAAAEAERQAAAAAAPTQKVATFQNLGTDPAMAQAELYYESTRWGPLGHGSAPVTVGTFPGHRWFIVANGCYAKLFTVGEEAQQTFTF
ncbi:expressed unknown protein [Seminavis robusta]|uniref:Uncharacterized protein n=1 Tax=Seminavis robusta TaxID=568900 RepID=A0A9N8DB57_9STRA|nr:expressed unknown protein [Seminavis robusta]|eukprot:Sro61_g035170.1 n/a (343) ;mRNA; r:116884-118004